ncbi:MAG: alpha/beta hydrolase [Parvibaculaceae bacterium]
MPLDHVNQEIVDRITRLQDEIGQGRNDPIELELQRRFVESLRRQIDSPSLDSVEDILVSGTSTHVPARIYRPRKGEPLPVLVYMHGGGWCLGDQESSELLCRNLAIAADTIIISVDYRLAPEAPYPAALNDCYQVLCWVESNADTLGIKNVPLMIGGDSAGANLALAVASLSRDRADELSIGSMILIYPCVAPELDTRSCELYGEDHVLTRRVMRWFWENYIGSTNLLNPPAYTTFDDPSLLHDLPDAIIVTAECDILRDEGEQLARNLTQAGSKVHQRSLAGTFHGFVSMIGILPQADECLRYVSEKIQDTVREFPRRE